AWVQVRVEPLPELLVVAPHSCTVLRAGGRPDVLWVSGRSERHVAVARTRVLAAAASGPLRTMSRAGRTRNERFETRDHNRAGVDSRWRARGVRQPSRP